ncbi:MAG: hypothetical protein K2L98_01165, partial [Bacilli bacterium]|nr:hypothetical protein [Bacilli bacterium]
MRYKFRSFLILTGVLLFMVIGYAAVSVTFKFEGVAQVGSDAEDFKVSFTRALLDGEDVTSTAISSGGLQLKYQSGALKLADEKSVMEFVITNNSKQYDTKMQLVCDKLTDSNANLEIDLESKRADAGEHVNGTITVSLKNDYPQPEDSEEEAVLEVEVSCRLKLTALERTSKGEDASELEEKEYKETLLNGADPVLAEGMIPVNINDNGKVTYANINKVWYKYADKEWANAVILKDGIERMYNVGNVIKEEDIESYFVWIPRYKYKLWNVDSNGITDEVAPEASNAQAIDIIFETNEEEASLGTKNGEWLTHPAFTNFDVNGIWVGKYQTTAKDVTSYNGGTYINAVKPEMITIKPQGWFWRNTKIGNMFKSAYQYKRSLDSHMMKNTEWGAVAYLSHSRYGINGEIRINNFTLGGSGYSSSKAPTCATTASCNNWVNNTTNGKSLAYNTETGYLASTTGDISGIYDMSGAFEEYVAAYVDKGTISNLMLNESELEQYSKYFDVYSENSTATSYENRILGDATGEMGPFYNYEDDDNNLRSHNNWYSDLSNFVDSTNSFFTRGGGSKSGILAGQFAFNVGNGVNA